MTGSSELNEPIDPAGDLRAWSLPALLSSIPILASLDLRSRALLSEGVKRERYVPGEVLLRQGEFTESVFILIEEAAAAVRARLDGTVARLASLESGSWFGEMPALANQPHPITITATRKCSCLVLEGALFKRLVAADIGFRRKVDEQYCAHALPFHLRSVPLFRGLSHQSLRWIAHRSSVVTCAADDIIAREGEVARSLHLVRTGVVKRIETGAGVENIAAYHCDNATFGARCMTTAPEWPQTFVAMTRCDLVVIDAQVLDELKATAPGDHERIIASAYEMLDIASAALDSRELSMRDSRIARIDLLINSRSSRHDEALAIDLDKCVRCGACLSACAEVHADGVPRLSRRGPRIGGVILASACFYCHVPQCMLGCAYGAIRRRAGGPVGFIYENCTACGACAMKCPHDVIRMTPQEDALPVKCDRCAGLPFEACLYNCPCGAISHVSPQIVVP